MRGLAKINRGLLLTIVAVLAAVLYVVVVTARQNASKPDIERVCKSYVAAATEASMLPASLRTDKPSLTQAQLDTCIDGAKKKMSAFYPAGSAQLTFVLRDCESSLKTQASGDDVLLSAARDIQKFTDFAFSGDTVTVTLQCETSLRRSVSGPVSGQTTDTVTLQKTGGQWKVVYASLSEPASAEGVKAAG